jgi:hypothetical protein
LGGKLEEFGGFLVNSEDKGREDRQKSLKFPVFSSENSPTKK